MEKVILAALQTKDKTKLEVENSLGELESLCLTAGAKSVAKLLQKRDVPDAAYFVGRGKALKIKEELERLNAGAVVFDDVLKPLQQRNLEKLIGKKVIDRTRVILDIFAYRARTKEGKLQVERAEMTYHLARLANRGVNMDSQTGGIGTRRGPGERKIESDKRLIRDAIAALDEKIAKIKERRDIQRSGRSNSDLPEIAIAGYTNAGKSTLLKCLSKSEVYADDRLFATLDPLTRKVKLPGGRTVLLTDTVGFIDKLPRDLTAAFRSTMEEILRAKCILHVIDISNPYRKKQIDAVLKVLSDIGAQDIPVITVYNKSDRLEAGGNNVALEEDACLISAKNSFAIKELLEKIENTVIPRHHVHKLKINYKNQKTLCKIYGLSNVKSELYNKKDILLTVESSDENWAKIKNIIKGDIKND
ncbi:MAG: GTPase HflX [Endomicrobium sp.]|jgi:GTP-binding protein HflX|nr:GTPase HflX [Endomicrobium sp.]